MILDFNIPIISIALFVVAITGILYISLVYKHRVNVVMKRKKECDLSNNDIIFGLPRASVVVYARSDAEVLEQNLIPILEQNYLGRFEVIVVNDGASHETSMLVTRLKNKYSNLYLTFTPDEARNLSRKKLAITLGIKASKGEIIVVTDATTRIASPTWLEKMMLPFTNPDTEVVLGYNYPNFPAKRYRGRLVQAFDSAEDDVAWLSAAIAGKPYRGCGSNIAYRKDLFFRNKGFSNSLNMRDGDDDIFVNEITNKRNTVVEISDPTIGVSGKDYDVRKRMRRSRLSHAFTGKKLPKFSRRIMALGDWMIWIVLLSALAGGFMSGYTNIVGWCIAAILILVMCIMLVITWRKPIITLGGPKMRFTIPFIAAFRPLRNMMVNMRSSHAKNANYTWQERKN